MYGIINILLSIWFQLFIMLK